MIFTAGGYISYSILYVYYIKKQYGMEKQYTLSILHDPK